MKPPRLFAEIPAGLGSVSLVLQGGRHCKPPVSRMGNKHGYALPILDAMGLRPGQGAESYLWCEADPDVRALLCAYTQPDLLRAVAEVLRGWVDEEPRALWTRLRDERRARVAALTPAEHVAEWMFLHHGSFSGKDIEGGMGAPQGIAGRGTFSDVRPSREIVHDAALRLSRGPGWPPVAVTPAAPSAVEVAGWLFMVGKSWKGDGDHWKEPADPTWSACLTAPELVRRCTPIPWPPTLVTAQAPSAERVAGWAMIVASNRLINVSGPELRNTGKGGTTFGGAEFATPAAEVADGFERGASPWPPTCITSRAPTAEEVAAWVALGGMAYQQGEPESGFAGAPGNNGGRMGCPLLRGAERVGRLAEVSTRPTEPTPGADLEGCVIYMDPPYVGTTGYGADLPRAEVVRLATEYAAAGALVVVSEAVAIPELTALGWDAVNIGGERRGQRRTFGATEEWITMSRPPVNRPATQGALFAMGGA